VSLFKTKTPPAGGVKKSLPLYVDASQTAAVNLDKVPAVDLRKKAYKAGIALSRRSLAGLRCQVVLVLDHSASMRPDYRSGAVQQLVERALGFALQVDADGQVPVIPFDWQPHDPIIVGLDNYRDIVNKQIWRNGQMGSTNLADTLAVVRGIVEGSDLAVFCVVVTDGSPDNKPATTRIVCELAGYPVFLKFLAIKPVDYLEELDDGQSMDARRLLDNVDAKFIGDPTALTDLQFAEAMVDEVDTWIARARTAGVLT
jgi:vWA found in TerF C terminus